MMDKKEVVRFVRMWAYTNIFVGPFTTKNPLATGVLSMMSLAVLHFTDDSKSK